MGLKKTSKRTMAKVILYAMTVFVLFAALIYHVLFSEGGILDFNPKMTVQEIRNSWEIPSDATDITLEGEHGYLAYLKLSFESSGSELANFTRHICDGVLHQGYDPYNAVNVFHPINGQRLYLIKHAPDYWAYYSYSPNTPETTWGNRCQPSGGAPVQIRVSQLNTDLYEVKVDEGHHLWGEKEKHCKLIPCPPPLGGYVIDVRPVDHFPLVVIGLEETSPRHYLLVANEFCLDFWVELGWSPIPIWKYLKDSTFNLMVDNQVQGKLVVSDVYNHLTSEARKSAYGSDFYCVTQDWTSGEHSMQFDVLRAIGQKDTYSWDFYVE